MIVTNEMVHAAVKQAVRDKILPTHAHEELYLHHYASVRRMLELALDVANNG